MDIDCMAKQYYERVRGMNTFNMPKLGNEGVIRVTNNQYGTTYRFSDGSRLCINDKNNSIQYATRNEGNYIAIRQLFYDPNPKASQ